jgi:hypothetical protein
MALKRDDQKNRFPATRPQLGQIVTITEHVVFNWVACSLLLLSQWRAKGVVSYESRGLLLRLDII